MISKHFMWSLLTFAILHNNPVLAMSDDGRCYSDSLNIYMNSSGEYDTNLPVRVLRENAPVFKSETDNTVDKTLPFDEKLLPIKKGVTNPSRFQVRRFGHTGEEPLGWINGEDILCTHKPLISEKGLERRAYVRTSRSDDPTVKSVRAYPSPDKTDCYKDKCKDLSRFDLYFIFADDKEHKRYLISSDVNLASVNSKPLTGWVSYNDVIQWNTVIAAKPQDNLKEVIIGTSVDDEKKEVQVRGGNDWYTYIQHIPILEFDKEKARYRVAAPGLNTSDGLKGLDTNILNSLKRVDVFFLIDGTNSMGPYIEEVKNLVKNIGQKLVNEPNFIETDLRFGFRIYRDNYADNKMGVCTSGICEGLSLPSNNCALDKKGSEKSLSAFLEEIEQVTESQNDADDFPEKLFAGLDQAIDDISSCKDRIKILFVLGDHGDHADILPEEILKKMTNFPRRVVFFVQTPNDNKQEKAQDAYRKFSKQSLDIINRLNQGKEKSENISATQQANDFLLSLDNSSAIPSIIGKTIESYSNSGVLGGINDDLNSGMSLNDILNKHMEEKDLPIVFLKWIDDVACSKLGEQCKDRVYHDVQEFYIPSDPNKVQQEIWVSRADLDKWIDFLRPFDDLRIDRASDQKEKFKKLITKQVESLLGGNLITPDESLGEQLRKLANRQIALPVRESSPLLQYSLKEIDAMNSECELPRLIEWVASIHEVLVKVSGNPTMKVELSFSDYSSSSCSITEKGQRLKKINISQKSKLGPNDTYRYDRTINGQTIFWLPIEFLP